MTPTYLRILGKINAVFCSILALIVLFAGFRMVYENILELYHYGSFIDYLFFWEYAGSLLFFIPLAIIIIFYGTLLSKNFKDYLEGRNSNFVLALYVLTVIGTLLFIYSIWCHFIVFSILLAVPIIYIFSIHHFLKFKPLQ